MALRLRQILRAARLKKAYVLKWALLSGAFLLFFFIFLISAQNLFYWDVYTERDIQRALGWLEGRIYWPGPEMSSGGHLPGPFFYFLLLPPFLFGENIYSQSALWAVIWLSLSYAAAFYFTGKITRYKESLLIFVFVFFSAVASGSAFQPFEFAWNPLFSLMFHILALMGLYFWRERDKSLYLYLAGLAIALGTQTHFLVFSHIIAPLLFCAMDRGKRLVPVLLFSLLASAPWLVYFAAERLQMFLASGINDSHLHNLKNMLFSQRWREQIKIAFLLPYIGLLIASLFLIFRIFSNLKTKKPLRRPISRAALELFLIIIIPSAIAFWASGLSWYTLFIPAFFMIFLSKFMDDIFPKTPAQRLNWALVFGGGLIGCALLAFRKELLGVSFAETFASLQRADFILPFAALALFMAFYAGFSRKHLWKFLIAGFFLSPPLTKLSARPKQTPIPKSFQKLWPSQNEMFPLMKRVYLETGWPPPLAAQRFTAVGLKFYMSFLAHYAIAVEKHKGEFKERPARPSYSPKHKIEFKDRPDGYMIIQHLQKFIGYSEKEWRDELIRGDWLSDFIKQEIKQNKLAVKAPRLYGRLWLIPYKMGKNSSFAEGFNNIGQPYYWEEPEWLKKCFYSQTFRKADDFYYCMVKNEEYGSLKKAGAHIKIKEQLNKPVWLLDVNFYGALIGTSSWGPNIGIFSLWHDIELKALCTGRRLKRALPNIGMNRRLSRNDRKAARRLASPLKLSFKLSRPCPKKELKKIELAFSHFYANIIRPEKKKIVWEIN